MAETETVRVNFSKPMPIFPLGQVVLLPHTIAPLYVFEPRYRQMTNAVLDGSGQIAMAVYRPEGHEGSSAGSIGGPRPIHDTVCIGQIIRHEKNADGTYRLWLNGICRARVIDEQEPNAKRLYRTALLSPAGPSDADAPQETDDSLAHVRKSLMSQLSHPALVNSLEHLREQAEADPDIPTDALLELVSLALIRAVDDQRFAWRVLREPSVFERAALVEGALRRIARTLEYATRQHDPDAPKGMTWN